ncbi:MULTISPECIES: hypothetical protein [Sphingomonas]|uniref:Uncharacterized protein n=1 Tax=Sphingomonas molluscorum TaxID=418184 RepID=A0ABU8Q7T1_9SPHN|nr:hypothetical protein [Sphingomonas sp. JUb134]MBM7407152.1 hypothetical protein [Sphingomonas sp. JUb134]
MGERRGWEAWIGSDEEQPGRRIVLAGGRSVLPESKRPLGQPSGLCDVSVSVDRWCLERLNVVAVALPEKSENFEQH